MDSGKWVRVTSSDEGEKKNRIPNFSVDMERKRFFFFFLIGRILSFKAGLHETFTFFLFFLQCVQFHLSGKTAVDVLSIK